MFKLDGRTAFITGAATGIGLAIAEAFVKQGARVVLTDVASERLEEAQAKLAALEGEVLAVACDVTDPASVERACKESAGQGFACDTLVNNAGVIHVGTVLETTLEDLRRVYRVNVEGVFNVTKALLPGMIGRGGGVICNMASLASHTAMHDRFAYASSKAAVMMMTRSVALDFVKQNIRANCICPARVHTEMVDNYLKTAYAGREEETFRKFSDYQPIGRMIRPDEVAAMAVYLCSDEAAAVTGASYLIDGGVMAGN